MRVTLRVLNPGAEIGDPLRLSGASRPIDLSGKKIGILKNGKPASHVLVPYIEEALKKRVQGIDFRDWIIPVGAPEESKGATFKDIVEYSDAVIALTGD
ncbi:hypothetical protein ACFLX3_04450 [Chloroflexota bacterium]